MKEGSPFFHARTMLATINSLAMQFGPGTAAFQAAVASLPVYVSHGKGTGEPHNRGGTRAFQRAAMKRRNRAKNRRAHRGRGVR